MDSEAFMFAFDQSIHSKVSLCDLSQDLIVSTCIDYMDRYVSTISEETSTKDQLLDQLATWKTATANSGSHQTKKLPGSVVFPMLSSPEK